MMKNTYLYEVTYKTLDGKQTYEHIRASGDDDARRIVESWENVKKVVSVSRIGN
jgi:hypothetical protein